MSRKIVFHDLQDFRHLYWQAWPEARIARHFRISRPVVRRFIEELGLLPRDDFDSNRFLAEERGLSERRAYASAANAARRKARRAVNAALAAYATDTGRQIFLDSLIAELETHRCKDRPTRRGGDRCLVMVRQ